ncbi:hypothetical protein K8O68_12485 [Salipaludibacillus sp. CUR1]|uniref:hypothetical protein n=1 Tax=Salipaludibacillus sp. CUR1 TaxID=2820003 RepID=UPI001E5AB349|nr:hypothetical protein [Salipaludibacillus sp. CUR1]MCE7793236.1 hypothetical protein [Salipaludibacillus sp. CUR1]
MNEEHTCPNCGGTLIDDIWETINTSADGSYTIHSFLAKKCLLKCGYFTPLTKEE